MMIGQLQLGAQKAASPQAMPQTASPSDFVSDLANFFTLSISLFDVGKVLGTGSFARVNFVKHKITGLNFALKRMKKNDIVRLDRLKRIHFEVSILRSLHHPSIVKFAGTFVDSRYHYLILEYVPGGEFYSILRNRGRLEEKDAKFYAAQVTLMFEYIHSQGFIYRDLKPENLLLDKNGYLKLTDFGSAKKIEKAVHQTLCSTPEYIAPEVLLMKEHDGKGIDWWTLGIFVYEMLVGQPPFFDEDPGICYQLIISGKLSIPIDLGEDAKKFVKKLLIVDNVKRMGCSPTGAKACKKHRWFSDVDWEELTHRKVPAAISPSVTAEDDTTNFDVYPESLEEPPEVEYDDEIIRETIQGIQRSDDDLLPEFRESLACFAEAPEDIVTGDSIKF